MAEALRNDYDRNCKLMQHALAIIGWAARPANLVLPALLCTLIYVVICILYKVARPYYWTLVIMVFQGVDVFYAA